MLASSIRPLPLALALLAGCAVAHTSNAGTFNVKHSFTWTPCSSPLYAAVVDFTFANARATRCHQTDLDALPGSGVYSLISGSTFTAPCSSSASAGNSSASASALVAVTGNSAGTVSGFLQNTGNQIASSQGCSSWWPFRIRFGWADAVSWSGMKMFQSNLNACGSLSWLGTWTNRSSVGSGGATGKLVIDPVIGTVRRFDGTSQSWKFLSVTSTVTDGETTWRQVQDGPVVNSYLDNSSPNMTFEVVLDVPQTSGPNLTGTYRIVVKNGVLDTTQTIHTGAFATRPLPTTATFANLPFQAIAFNYNMGGTSATNQEVIIGIDGGGEDAVAPEVSCLSWDNERTNLGAGFNNAPTSSPAIGDSSLGFAADSSTSHVADDFTVSSNPTYLDYISVPYFQTGSTSSSDLTAAYVRIWSGIPGLGGTVFAGDLTTNRLADIQDSAEVNVYRAARNALTDSTRPLRRAIINLADMPALPGGTYSMEVAFDHAAGAAPVQVIPLGARSTDNGRVFNSLLNTWSVARDSLSNRAVDFNFHIVCRDAPICRADFNQDDSVDFFDYLDFVNDFTASSAAADFNSDGSVDFFDYLDFIDAFTSGC